MHYNTCTFTQYVYMRIYTSHEMYTFHNEGGALYRDYPNMYILCQPTVFRGRGSD